MDQVEADAQAGTQLCEECGEPVPQPEPGAAQGRPRKYCGRGCQSKVYRRNKARKLERQLADAVQAARVESGSADPGQQEDLAANTDDGQADDADPDADLDDDPDYEAMADATPRELVQWHADQIAKHARHFLRNLEDGYDPDQDRVLRHLHFYSAVHVSKMFANARKARNELREPRPEGSIAPWAEGREEFFQMVAWKDPAALPVVSLAQAGAAMIAADDDGGEEPPSADPVARLGYPPLILPMEETDQRWADWTIAGWREDRDNVLVRHRNLTAGWVQRVGTRWVAVADRRYLREGLGGFSNKLRWFDTALDAADAVAMWHQEQWEETDPVPTLYLR